MNNKQIRSKVKISCDTSKHYKISPTNKFPIEYPLDALCGTYLIGGIRDIIITVYYILPTFTSIRDFVDHELSPLMPQTVPNYSRELDN